MKFLVNGIYERFNVIAEVEAKNIVDLKSVLNELRASGFAPTNPSTQTRPTAQVTHQAAFNAQAPLEHCPIHHKPFRQNSKGNFCATKLEDDSWCTENGKSKQRSFVDARPTANHPDTDPF